MEPFYYTKMTKQQQAAYHVIMQGANALADEFQIPRIESAELYDVFFRLRLDHPEIFWMTGYKYKYYQDSPNLIFVPEYLFDKNKIREHQRAMSSRVEKLARAAKDLSEWEKEKYIHDALAEAVTYDLAADRNQSAYSALVDGNSVCAGYARAYQYLLQQLGIPCYYCTGYSGGNHAWNIVKLDDGYYNVDVTWDDADTIRYNYFNKTDADFASTHVRQNLSVYLPACNGTAYRQESVAAGDGQQTNVVNGDGTVPDANGGEETTSAQPGNSLSDYINPNPQEPLRYPGGNTGSSDSGTAATPAPRSDAVTDLNSYYANCITQLSILGSGDQHFDNVVSKSLWSTIEQAYNTGAYEQGYVAEVLKKLGMENFVIQLQLVDLGDGYYRVYHNVVTY